MNCLAFRKCLEQNKPIQAKTIKCGFNAVYNDLNNLDLFIFIGIAFTVTYSHSFHISRPLKILLISLKPIPL